MSFTGKLQELEKLYEQHEDGLKQKLALLESANAELQQKMLHEIQITKVDGAKPPLETKPEKDHLHNLEDALHTLKQQSDFNNPQYFFEFSPVFLLCN